MKLFLDFFRQEVPKNRGKTFYYYQQSIRLTDQMLVIYFFVSFLVVSVAAKRLFWPPVVLQAALLLKHFRSERLSIVLVLLVFFCLYEPPLTKVCYFSLLLAIRMLLFQYTSNHAPRFPLTSFSLFVMQTVNSVSLFLILACCCIMYSSNLQEAERRLLLHNEKLQMEAETDPLTKLINRRGLYEIMNQFVTTDPQAMYCVAIADIDLFKRINDTYGHNCGDYTLQRLSALFKENAEGRYAVSRWGGEEFCFFFPDVNIDEAGSIITDLLIAVRKMELEYEGNRFSITLTAGVEENDYRSSLQELIESADRKLYRGKQNGRDQIVF